jgi:hypothetical protein
MGFAIHDISVYYNILNNHYQESINHDGEYVE